MSGNLRYSVRSAAIVVLLLFFAAGCGADDGDDVTGATSGAASDPAGATADDGESDPDADSATTSDESVDGAGEVGDQASGESVELRMIIWDANQVDSQQALADAFHQQRPDITITVEHLPWADYWAVAQTSVAAGNAPDLLWMNGPNFPVFEANDLLLELDDSIDLSPFPTSLVDLYTRSGRRLGVPKDYDTIGMFYNKDLFDAAGVDYPTNDWTWADLQAAAAELTTDEADGFISAGYYQEYVLPAMVQTGAPILSDDGNEFLIDDPVACEAMAYLESFVADGSAADWTTVDATPAPDLFAQGKGAMYFDGSWMAGPTADYAFPVGAVQLPAGNREGTIVHGLSWAAMSSTQHPEEAMAFLQYLATEEAQMLQAESGAVISAYAGTQQTWVDSLPGAIDGQVFIDAVDNAEPFPVANAPYVWISDSSRTVIDDLIAGDDVATVCADAAEAAAVSIEENRVSDAD